MSDFLDRTDYVDPDEEEEEVIEEPKRRGRPRPPEFVPDNFNSSFRATPGPKHGGAQYVTEADTLGEVLYCWCGEEYPHDWPGKASGKKHPRKETAVTPRDTVVHNPAEADTISRTDLRGYHRSLQDFILQEVNQNGLRYRVNKNAVLLYPLDGTIPINVHARNTDNQIRNLASWHNKHVKPALDLLEKGEVDEAAIAALAAQVNDPVEHPVAPEPQEAPVEAAVVEEAREAVEQVDTAVHVRQAAKRPEGWVDPLAFEIDYSRVPYHYGAPRGWTWYTGTQGDLIEAIATNGEDFMCVYCEKAGFLWRGDKARMIGGHRRTRHSPNIRFGAHRTDPPEASDGGTPPPAVRLHTPEVRERARVTRGASKRAKADAVKAIDALCAALSYYPKNPTAPEVKVGVPQTEYDKVVAERDDALARVALIEEAFRGL